MRLSEAALNDWARRTILLPLPIAASTLECLLFNHLVEPVYPLIVLLQIVDMLLQQILILVFELELLPQ